MKRGRILSLFLSIVLVVSTIIPCLQMSVNADAANAISEIKTAWNQLQYKTTEGFTASKNDFGGSFGSEWSMTLTSTTTPADKENYGSSIYTLTDSNTASGVRYIYKNSTVNNYLTVADINNINDVYVNVSSNRQIKLKLIYRVDFSYDGGTVYAEVSGSEITVPGDGTVTKISGLGDNANFKAAVDAYVAKNATLNAASNVKATTFSDIRLVIVDRIAGEFAASGAEMTVGMGMVSFIGNPPVPTELSETDDLLKAISIAEDAIQDPAYENKTPLQTAVDNAWAVVKADEDLLIKAMQESWTKLLKLEDTVKSFTAYNKTGLASALSWYVNQTSGSNLKEGYNDRSVSGQIDGKFSSTDEDIRDYGNKYVMLTKEDPDVVGVAPDYNQDIPSFKVGDTLTTTNDIVDFDASTNSLYFNIYSTKAVKFAYRIWYKQTATANMSATNKLYFEVPANELYTVDLKKLMSSLTVASVSSIALAIDTIEGEVGDNDYIKVGSIFGALSEKLPSSVSGDVSLAVIYNAAVSLDLTQYYDGAAKDRFLELIDAAKVLITAQWSELFKDKDSLIKAIKEDLWPALLAKNPVTVKKFTNYNSSGERDSYSSYYTADGAADRAAEDSNYKFGITDASNSGNTVSLMPNAEQAKYYGDSYVKLTTQKFENNGTELNADKSNDIPWLNKKHSVVVSERGNYSISGAKALNFTVNASMPMSLQIRMWCQIVDKPTKENATTTKTTYASKNITVDIPKGYYTVDLLALIDSIQTEIDALPSTSDNYQRMVVELSNVSVGIFSMSNTPTDSDYLEIGAIQGIFFETLPTDLADADLIRVYDEMNALDMDDYVDDIAKENFINAKIAAKDFVDEMWEEIYQDPDELAYRLKNEIWPKLIKKTNFDNKFLYYNSTGKRENLSEKHDQSGTTAIEGTTSDVSGRYNGSASNSSQKEIYGDTYFKLTTTKTSGASSQTDRDIPYLSEDIVSLSRQEKAYYINVPGSDEIFFYMKASMPMTIKTRIWYYVKEDKDQNGKLDDMDATQTTFNIQEGLNKIDLLELFTKLQIKDNMDTFLFIGLAVETFDHTPTRSDYLEIGSIGYNAYAKVPERLNAINELSAIVREARELNMDDYIDNDNKILFQTALAKAIDLLNNLDVNLTEHVPVEIYETDAEGKRTKLSEDKFGYEDQKKLYDKNTTDNAVEFDVKDKKIDIIYNLSDKMKIYDLRVFLQENNVKNMKIYTSPVREAIWDESGFVYEYDGSTPSALDIGRALSEPIENQYVRFSFNEVDGDTLKITEIKCVGKGIQQLAYTNLIYNKKDILKVAELDYNTGKTLYLSPESNKFGDTITQWKDPNVLFDGYLNTPYDFVGGSRIESDKLTYNIILNLGGVSAVDTITFRSASNEEYFPQKMNFYIADDEMKVLDNNDDGTQLVKTFEQPTEDGVYKANFLARNAAFVRIEIVKDGTVNNTGDYGDKLLTVASDIEVDGLSLNVSAGDSVKSFTDEESGIVVDILKLSDGDIYEGVQGMKVTKRKPTAAEVEQASGFTFIFKDWFYSITLLNYRGEPVTDVEGREIRVSVPFEEGEEEDTCFMATLDGDDVVLMEHNILEIGGKKYMSVIFDDPTKIRFAKGIIDEELVDDYIEEDDFYEDFFEEELIEEEEEEEEETSSRRRKKYYKVIRRSGGLDWWVIVAIAVGSLILIAAVVLLIIFRKKIFKSRKKSSV